MVPVMHDETRPAAVILPCSLELLYELSPGGLPHVRLAAVRASLYLIEIQIVRRQPCPGVSNGRNGCQPANDSCSHPPMSVKRDLLLMTLGTSERVF